ncbi:MAG: 3-deoxy-manno-octulosonate cytidylyltransferase [Marinifilaceae bacterium]
MDIVIIIPARYASTRFPGKPLVEIHGKPMVWHVVEKGLSITPHVYVATDDERIANKVTELGGKAVMTSVNHKSGTDRCYEAYNAIVQETGQLFDVIINVQGDEPFIDSAQITDLANCFTDETVDIATLAKRIEKNEELFDANKVKVVFTAQAGALYFSRSTIPYLRGVEQTEWLNNGEFYKHIGMYAYRPSVLKEITQLPQSKAEIMESLEQLRWLENGYKIGVKQTNHESIGIDTPEDLQRVL